MKLGIISDIHGDCTALETVLDRLENGHQVDHILCAGDLVGRGPEPERVVQAIRERGIFTVRGNHDEWSYGMSQESKLYLKALPLDWRGRFDGMTVFMCHGKPGNNLWGLYRDHISDTLLNMMLASLQVDILVTGHTHMPLFVRVKHGVVVNPGSLYTFDNVRPSSHTYGVLHLPDLHFELFDLMREPGEPVRL